MNKPLIFFVKKMKKVSEKFGYCENSQYLCGVKKSERYEVNRKRKGVNRSN